MCIQQKANYFIDVTLSFQDQSLYGIIAYYIDTQREKFY